MNKDKILSVFECLRFTFKVIAEAIQYLLAVVIMIGIIVQLTGLPDSLSRLYQMGSEGFREFLEYVLSMVIGVELINIFCNPNLDNIVEILLIAITRELVFNSSEPFMMISGVVCIAILFAVRKFLFIRELDKEIKLINPLKSAEERLHGKDEKREGPEAEPKP